MTVLITGGTGFLGSALARYLIQEMDEGCVVLFDRHPHLEAVADIHESVKIVKGEVLDLQALTDAIQGSGVDRIAHLGFPVGVVDSNQIPRYVEDTCLGTTRVYEAAKVSGIKRVVDASSCAVYGRETVRDQTDQAPPAKEDDAPSPDNIYGAIKLANEWIAETYNQDHGMEIISLRTAPTFGHGRLERWSRLDRDGLTQDRKYFMGFPELVFLGETVTMPPDDLQSDFLYIDDAAQALALALSVEKPPHSIFNLRGEQRPVGDMTRELRSLATSGSVNTTADEAVTMMRIMDNSRIIRELGFQPKASLEGGLSDHRKRISTIIEVEDVE